MKRTASLVLTVAVLILLPVMLQAESNVKVWGMRGTAWKQCSDTEKTVYLQGVLDGLMFAGFKVDGEVIPPTASLDQLAKATNRFYTDAQNQHIPVVFVLKLAVMELNGKPADALTKELNRLRSKFSK